MPKKPSILNLIIGALTLPFLAGRKKLNGKPSEENHRQPAGGGKAGEENAPPVPASPKDETPEAGDRAHYDGEQAKPRREPWLTSERLIVVLTALLAVGNFIYTFTSVRQLSESVATRELENRPFLIITSARIERFPKDKEGLGEFVFSVENTGATAAIDAQMRYRVSAEGFDLPNESLYEGLTVGGVVAPRSKDVEWDGLFIRLTPQDIKAYHEGIRRIVFRGEITYRDIFGKEHATEFCYDSQSYPHAEYAIGQCVEGNTVK